MMQQYTWFYTFAQPISTETALLLESDFRAFLAKWQSHGTPIAGDIYLKYGQFVVVQSSNEANRPSGCSIDGMKRAVETLLQKYGIACVDAAHIAYRNTAEEIEIVHFQEMGKRIAAQQVDAHTLVFDHSLNDSDDLSKWEQPLAQTWMRRWLKA